MRKSERREAILQTASELFGRKGYLETKMTDIAEACGIAKGTMYEYFSSKDELAAEWSKKFVKEYKDRIECDMRNCSSPSEKLKTLIYIDLEYFRRFSGHLMVVFQPEQLFHCEKSDFLTEIASIFTYHYQLVSSLIEEGQRCGEFRKTDPAFSATMLIGMFLSFQRSKILSHTEKCVSDLYRQAEEWNDEMLIDYFLHGLAA